MVIFHSFLYVYQRVFILGTTPFQTPCFFGLKQASNARGAQLRGSCAEWARCDELNVQVAQLSDTRPGKHTKNYGKIHPCYQWVNSLFLWPLSIVMLVYQRVPGRRNQWTNPKPRNFPRKSLQDLLLLFRHGWIKGFIWHITEAPRRFQINILCTWCGDVWCSIFFGWAF